MAYNTLFFIIGALSKLEWSEWRAVRKLKPTETIICANNSGDKAVQSSKGRHKQQKISFSGKFPLKRMTPELDHLEAYGSFSPKDTFWLFMPPPS